MSSNQFINSDDRKNLDTYTGDISARQIKTSITRFTPTTGQTITIPNTLGDQIIIIAPATDIAALTIAWSSTPYAGQCIRILSTKNITALTHSGGTLNRSVNSFQSCCDANFIWDATGSTWMCDGMTISPAVSLPFTGTVTNGDCIFYPTDSGLVGGNALFSSIQYITSIFDVADPLKAFSKPVVSNSNKTVTVNCKISVQNLVTILGISVIGSTTLTSAPNGTALSFLIYGTLT